MAKSLRTIILLAISSLPFFASAHEVYVLDHVTIDAALAAPSPNPFLAYIGNEYDFFFWGFVSVVVLTTLLFATFFRLFEQSLGPIFASLKSFAHPLIRLTIGATLLIFGWQGILYGPELPLSKIFGPAAGVLQIVLTGLGVAILAGVYTRISALIAIFIYLCAGWSAGWYILTYTGHLGGYVALLMLGAGSWPFGNLLQKSDVLSSVRLYLKSLAPLAFPVLRMLFGFGIMFAALYAKFIHSELALQTIAQNHLTDYLPFEPLFIVLGALIIEFLAGLMMFLGVAVRWTGLFLIFWLTMGHLSTNEAWWVHIILYGLGLAIFCHGYDRYSLEGYFLKKDNREPIL